MIDSCFKDLDADIWAVEDLAQQLYMAVGRMDHTFDQLVNLKEIQACGDDLAKIIRMRNACRDMLLHVDEFTDEVSRIKEWYEGEVEDR